MFGVAPKTIVEWQEQGMPIAERGRPGVPSLYDSRACIDWYLQREMNKANVETPRDRLARLQADEVELKLAERRGQLVPADQIEPMWTALVTAAKNHLRAEPDRLAHLLEHAEGVDAKRDMISETFDEFLRKLSKFDPEDDDTNSDDMPSSVGPGSAARAHAQGGQEDRAAATHVGGEVG